jgi:hypothetical protein
MLPPAGRQVAHLDALGESGAYRGGSCHSDARGANLGPADLRDPDLTDAGLTNAPLVFVGLTFAIHPGGALRPVPESAIT